MGIEISRSRRGALLALRHAAAACFVKAFGVTFLGRARTPAAMAAQETDRFAGSNVSARGAAWPQEFFPACLSMRCRA
jgi:hypothetical protein